MRPLVGAVHRHHRPRGPPTRPARPRLGDGPRSSAAPSSCSWGIGRPAEDHRSVCCAAACIPTTPFAAVRWGTRPEQRTVRATVGTILGRARRASCRHRVIVIGKVAAMNLELVRVAPRCSVTRSSSPDPPRASRRAWSTSLRRRGRGHDRDPADRGSPRPRPRTTATPRRRAAREVRTYDWPRAHVGQRRRRVHRRAPRTRRDLGGREDPRRSVPARRQALQDRHLVADLRGPIAFDRRTRSSLAFTRAAPRPLPVGSSSPVPPSAEDVPARRACAALGWHVDDVAVYQTRPRAHRRRATRPAPPQPTSSRFAVRRPRSITGSTRMGVGRDPTDRRLHRPRHPPPPARRPPASPSDLVPADATVPAPRRRPSIAHVQPPRP